MLSNSTSSILGHHKRPLDEATLVSQLNALLMSLNIPIPLISPTDLTPSLLIAILESLMGMRIPFFEREIDSKVQNMKIFLGVLETDILKTDVGLSDLDPRRLAEGEWEEILFVAELLCWIGRRMGFVKKDKKSKKPNQGSHILEQPTDGDSILETSHKTPTARPRALSPRTQLDLDAESVFQTGSTATGRSRNTLSPFTRRLASDESVTSLDASDHHQHGLLNPQSDDNEDALSSVSDVLGSLSPFKRPQAPAPNCIHEVPSPPSLPFSQDSAHIHSPSLPSPRSHSICPEHSRVSCSCDLSIYPIQSPPIRYSGYIEPVDEEWEIASYEYSRSVSISMRDLSGSRINPRARGPGDIKAAKAEYARTLELLNERARLLTQLAKIKNSHSDG